MKPYISMVTLGVLDVARAARFYREGLGFPQVESPPEVAFFNLHGSWLGLYGRADMAQEGGVRAAPSDAGSAITLAHNVASSQAVDQVLAQAEAAGATVTRRGRAMAWGGYCGHFVDLDGHLWEVAHTPFMVVGPQVD